MKSFRSTNNWTKTSASAARNGRHVMVCTSWAGWGDGRRAWLTATQARRLAAWLNDAADAIDTKKENQ